MKYFLDFEFHEHFIKPSIFSTRKVHTVEPISLGIVCEDGRTLSLIYNDFDVQAAWNNKWLRENVFLPMYKKLISGDARNQIDFTIHWFEDYIVRSGFSKRIISQQIQYFCQALEPDGMFYFEYRSTPEFYGYYCDYDWICFCQTFGTMLDLPTNAGFPMYCRDLKQIFDEKVSQMFERKEVLVDEFGIEVLETTIKHYEKAIKSMSLYPKQHDEHDALVDAKWNQQLFNFLNKL